MIATLIAVASLASPAPADIAEFAWMAGTWREERTSDMLPGTLEEVWLAPKVGSMQAVGRLFSGESLTYMEFKTLETGDDGVVTLYVRNGTFSLGPDRPIRQFKLESVREKKAVFRNVQPQASPQTVTYQAKGDDGLTVTYYSEVGPTKLELVFDFTRVKE